MKLRNERGQSLVELAISLVVLLYLLSGAVEFGLAFFQYVQLRDAAQEGALYGSMFPTDLTAIQARVRESSTSPIDLRITDPSDPRYVLINIGYIGQPCSGNGVRVTLSFNHQVFMPFMSRFVGNTIPLTATVVDTILLPGCP